MNYIIHLTEKCNLKCKYCYEKRSNNEISFEDIKAIIDKEIEKKSKDVIITFYGGEPLLKKELIYETIEYAKKRKSKTKFFYGMTTNGTLLDEEFVEFIKKNDFLTIAYSFDGNKKTQNLNRVTADGKGTFDIVEKNAKLLLENHKRVMAMVVVTKNNIENLEENIKYLTSIGFKNFNLLFDYLYDWQDEDLKIIKEQFNKVAEIYYNKILEEEDINISLFDEKIKTHIKDGYNCNEDCQLGMKSINVGTDGNFYPCMQFVGNEEFMIGNYKDGIDIEARNQLISSTGKEILICKECSVRKRCKHTCACRNFLTTRKVNELSPIVCEFERIVIDVSDKIAEKLYKQNSKLFLQKFYNKNYEVFKQIVEAKSKRKGE